MRTFTIDQFEFPDPSTEENLTIAVAAIRDFPYPTISAFAAAAIGTDVILGLPRPFSDDFAYGSVRKNLQQFAGICLPPACSWPAYVIADGPDTWHFFLCSPDTFIRYEWCTSA